MAGNEEEAVTGDVVDDGVLQCFYQGHWVTWQVRKERG